MDLWASCLTEGTLCLTLPCKGRAAGALLQMSPHLGQSLCAGDGEFNFNFLFYKVFNLTFIIQLCKGS